MTALAIAASIIGISCAAIIYGTDVFCALVLCSAAAGARPSSIADLIGRVHHYGDRRLPVPGAASLLAAAIVAAASRSPLAQGAGAVVVAALLTAALGR
jgi:hypothetical protein